MQTQCNRFRNSSCFGCHEVQVHENHKITKPVPILRDSVLSGPHLSNLFRPSAINFLKIEVQMVAKTAQDSKNPSKLPQILQTSTLKGLQGYYVIGIKGLTGQTVKVKYGRGAKKPTGY